MGVPPRVFLTLLLWSAINASAFAVGLVAAFQPWAGRLAFEWGFAVVMFLTYGFMASRVAYRWRDTLVLLVPGYGLIWSVYMCWRFVGLPVRDWEPRPERKVATPALSVK